MELWYLLPVVDDVHTLQTDGHSHWFAPTSMQEALGWLVNLAMEKAHLERGLVSAAPSST